MENPGSYTTGFFLNKNFAQALFEHATDAIILADWQGTILIANSNCSRFFGFEDSELRNQPIEMVIAPRFRDQLRKYRDRFASNGHSKYKSNGISVYTVKKDNREFRVNIAIKSYVFEGNTYKLFFISDLSDQDQLESENSRLNDELEQMVTNRTLMLNDAMQQLRLSKDDLNNALNRERELNSLKSKFVSVASHEFRTPLTAILSSTILLQKYTLTDQQPQRAKHITRIFSSINTLNCILNDFLSLGKIEEGRITVNLVETDVNNLISSIMMELNNTLKAEQNFRYIQNGTGVFMLDPSMLKHILINLISNAIKYSPENTLIDIVLNNDDSILTIMVKDQGIGIPLENQAHLFEPFYRAPNASGIPGTGLGLNIVSNYVKMMNGTIACNSDKGKGTEMIVELHR